MALTAKRFAGNRRLQAVSNSSPSMRWGETGEAVAIVQQAFIDLDYPMPRTTGGGAGPPDGIFGEETASTVRQFQRQQGLTVDGVIGKETMGRLDAIFAKQEENLDQPPDLRQWKMTTARP